MHVAAIYRCIYVHSVLVAPWICAHALYALLSIYVLHFYMAMSLPSAVLFPWRAQTVQCCCGSWWRWAWSWGGATSNLHHIFVIYIRTIKNLNIWLFSVILQFLGRAGARSALAVRQLRVTTVQGRCHGGRYLCGEKQPPADHQERQQAWVLVFLWRWCSLLLLPFLAETHKYS